MSKIKNIILDLDGTLWDSREEIVIAWQEVLKEKCNLSITKDDLNSVMGKTIDAFKEKFFSNIDSKTADYYLDECMKNEVTYLTKNGAVIFPEVIEVLKHLHSNNNLFIVSNCQSGYIESFLTYYNLTNYFKDIECSGNTGLQKNENIKLIIERNNLNIHETCYVGDTEGDQNAAIANNIVFIYANYGFGKCNRYDHEINNFKELIKIID